MHTKRNLGFSPPLCPEGWVRKTLSVGLDQTGPTGPVWLRTSQWSQKGTARMFALRNRSPPRSAVKALLLEALKDCHIGSQRGSLWQNECTNCQRHIILSVFFFMD